MTKRWIIIMGPCVIESESMTLRIARALKKVMAGFDADFYFKASYDKANRTSAGSFRGPGVSEGIEILRKVKKDCRLKIVSDVHSVVQIAAVRDVLDVIQIPAFLCRQTDLLSAAARTGKIVNVKKGQFVSPFDMRHAVQKIELCGNKKIWLTERGTMFGYNNLVVDFRGIPIMQSFGHPVLFDATHSVQLPSGGHGCSAGERQYIVPLSKAAVACGCDGLFMEVHPQPEKALCDGANSLPLGQVSGVLKTLFSLRKSVSQR